MKISPSLLYEIPNQYSREISIIKRNAVGGKSPYEMIGSIASYEVEIKPVVRQILDMNGIVGNTKAYYLILYIGFDLHPLRSIGYEGLVTFTQIGEEVLTTFLSPSLIYVNSMFGDMQDMGYMEASRLLEDVMKGVEEKAQEIGHHSIPKGGDKEDCSAFFEYPRLII